MEQKSCTPERKKKSYMVLWVIFYPFSYIQMGLNIENVHPLINIAKQIGFMNTRMKSNSLLDLPNHQI